MLRKEKPCLMANVPLKEHLRVGDGTEACFSWEFALCVGEHVADKE